MTERIYTVPFSPLSKAESTPLRRWIRHFDWVLFCDVFLLSAIGLVTVYSASSRFGHPEFFLGKQVLAFLIGLFILFALVALNYQIFLQHSRALYLISILFLVLVLLAGTSHHGTRAWIELGPFSFQTSEASKILAILVLAGWCDRHKREMRQVTSLLVPFLIILSYMALILLQPDFGSTLVFFPILLGILYAAGATASHVLLLLVYGLCTSVVVLLHAYFLHSPEFLSEHPFWDTLHRAGTPGKEFLFLHLFLGTFLFLSWWFAVQLRWRVRKGYFFTAFLLTSFCWLSSSLMANCMKEYQRKRLLVFFNPGIDPLGSGYHAIQSVVAVGSGKVFGRGLFSGTQGRLGFLPEQHTDFIFSVLGEEMGFLFSVFVVLLFFVLVWRSISIAGDSRDSFGSIVAVGIGSMFAFYSILNLLMVMGFAPIVGLPLPFLSYGGSSLVSSLAAVGLLLSIHLRRYAH